MYITTSALVLRETRYKDSSKILTVLTGTEGKITVTARGALRKNSKLAAATQILAFSEMTLLNNRDRWTLTEGVTIELFKGLQTDIELMSMGSYFAELAEAVSDEDCPNPELLSLALNALYALSEKQISPKLVKPALETRIIKLAGLAPNLEQCAICNTRNINSPVLDLNGGVLNCKTCAKHSQTQKLTLSQGTLDAMRYILSCAPKRIFAFTLSGTALKNFSNVSEQYLLAQLSRHFNTLDYLKKIQGY